jgi:hypothetical protein
VTERLRLSPWFRALALDYLVPAWFLIFALVHVIDIVPEGRLGFDGRIYHRAAAAWLQGMDPWSTGITLPDRTYHFAGLPPTVLAFVPTTVVPEDIFGAISFIVSCVCAVWIVRKLNLAWTWLLFPPLVQGVLLGQPGIWVLALLLTGHPVAEALAAGFKVYALVPLLARFRLAGIVVFVVATVVSIAFFADLWVLWAQQGVVVASRLVGEASGGVGATAHWWLIPPTIAAVVVIAGLNTRAAGWLAVPALWPSAQYHYPVMALPAIRILPALVFAVPVLGAPAVAVILHAWLMLWDRFVSGTTSAAEG